MLTHPKAFTALRRQRSLSSSAGHSERSATPPSGLLPAYFHCAAIVCSVFVCLILRLNLLRACVSSTRPLVVLRCRCFVALSTRCSSSGSSLPPFLVSTLPHAFSSETNLWKRGWIYSFLAPCNNLCRRVQSQQLNSGELDVTPIRLATTMTASRSGGVESRQQGTQSTLQNPLYNMHNVGDERQLAGRESCSKFAF